MKRNLIIIMSMLAALLIAAFGTAYGADSDLVAEVSDITLSKTTVNAGDIVNLSFNLDEHYSGTERRFFRNGQTTILDTNLYDLLSSVSGDGSQEVTGNIYHDSTGEVIGSIRYAPGKITITWNELAESYRMTNYSSVFTLDYLYEARDINFTPEELTKTLKIGNAEASITWAAKPVTLAKSVSGNGSVAPSGTTTFSDSVTEEIISLTPNQGSELLSVKLQKSNGDSVDLKPSGEQLKITGDMLLPGRNTLLVSFTGDDVIADGSGNEPIRWAWLNKECWGVDKVGGKDGKAHFFVRVNSHGIYELFVKRNDTSDLDPYVRYSSLTVEDKLPGNGKPEIKGIYAPLPYYRLKDGNPALIEGTTAGNENNYAGKKDIRQYMKRVTQKNGESYSQFKERILSEPGYAWGDYLDPDTNETTLFFDFGAVGDPAVDDGLTYTQLYGSLITSDKYYSKAFGDDNIFGGKLQYFTIDYYSDHTQDKFGGRYWNTVTMPFKMMNGGSYTSTATSGSYTISRSGGTAQSNAGHLNINYRDRGNNENGIEGEIFTLWKRDENSWVPFTEGGTQVQAKTSGEYGFAEMPTLSPGTYRIEKKNILSKYASSKTLIRAHQNSASNVVVMPDGSFTIPNDVSNPTVIIMVTDEVPEIPVTYSVKYDANGGQGQLTDSDTYREGHVWRVLSPGDAVTRRGYYFTGWNDKADGTGTSYPVNSEHIMGNKDITLYAQWKETNAAVLDSPSLVKALEIVDAQPESAESFSFSCTPDKDNPADVRGLEEAAVISGSRALDEGFGRGLEFPEAGTYSFTVRENPGDSSHYEYDDRSYTWTVKVGEGRVSMSIEENKIDGNEIVGQGQFSFTNIYHRETELTPAKHDPPIKKVVSGDKPEKDAVFRFQLKAVRTTAEGVEVMPMPAGSEDGVKTVDVKGAGEYEFGDIVFTRAGHYEYEMSEIPTGENGYTYDGSVYRIVYIVSRHGNELKAERSITKDGEAADEAVFDNRYTAPAPEKDPDPKPEVKPGPSSGDTGGSSPEPSVTKKKDYKSSGDSGSSTKADTADEGKSSTSKAGRIVKTGDAGILIPAAALVSAAVLLLAFAAARKKRSEN